MLPGDAAALGLVVEPQGSSFDSHRIRGREGPFGTHGWKETLTPGRSAGRFLAAPFPINPDGEELPAGGCPGALRELQGSLQPGLGGVSACAHQVLHERSEPFGGQSWKEQETPRARHEHNSY